MFGWSHGVYSQEAASDESWCSVRFLLFILSGLVCRTMLPKVMQSLPTSVTPLETLPQMCQSVSYFTAAVIKQHDQKQLVEENLFWLAVPEGDSPTWWGNMAASSWHGGPSRTRAPLSITSKKKR